MNAEDVVWLHKFVNCVPFGADATQSDINRAHQIVDALALRDSLPQEPENNADSQVPRKREQGADGALVSSEQPIGKRTDSGAESYSVPLEGANREVPKAFTGSHAEFSPAKSAPQEPAEPQGARAVALISVTKLDEMLLRAEMAAEVTLPIEIFRDLCLQARSNHG